MAGTTTAAAAAANDSDNPASSGESDYESPSEDENSDSDSDNEKTTTRKRPVADTLLTYRPQKFVKAIDKAPSTPIRRGRKKKKNDTTLNRLLQLNRRTGQKKKDATDEESNSDSDSMGNRDNSKPIARKGPSFESRRKRKTEEEPKSELIELLDSSPESSPSNEALANASTVAKATPRITMATTSTTAATNVYSCLSSDDDDDGDDDSDSEVFTSRPKQPLNLPPDVAATLSKAQQAKARLEQAQVYHAQDVHVQIQEAVYVPKATPTVVRRIHAATPVDMGKVLSFTCRCTHLVIGESKEGLSRDQESKVLTIREKEPLSALVEKFCRAHLLPPQTSVIKLHFDGQNLDQTKTPTFYEMEDEDLIDVSASAPFRSSQQQQQQQQQQQTSSLLVSKTSKTGSLGKSMRFSCHTRITTAGTVKKRRGRPPKNPPPPPRPTIVSKTVRVCENENLGALVRRLCDSIGDLPPASTTKVVIRFDGNVLDTEKTPKFYDMEDQDMIEVCIEKR